MTTKKPSSSDQILSAIASLQKEVRKLRLEIKATKREKPKQATITNPEWCYEYPSMTIDLSVKQWKAVKSGEILSAMGRGYRYRFEDPDDSELSMQDYWIFNASESGSVKVLMDDGSGDKFLECAYDGALEDCEIEETEVERKRAAKSKKN